MARHRLGASCVAAGLCALLVGGVAFAENKDAARAAYADGTRYYDLNRFDLALEAFQRAYWNYEDPAFLYNIAQCHRQLRHKSDAIAFYRSYLRKLPDAPNRTEVQRLIGDLEAAIAVEKTTATSPPQETLAPAATATPAAQAAPANAVTAEHTPPPRRSIARRWWFWTALGVVVAGAATGIAVGVTQSGRTEPSLTTAHCP